MLIHAGATSGLTDPARVLIADDDARVRQALRALIECDPDIVVAGEAGSSREVLERDHSLSPSVVLLDLILPSEEEGMAALKQLVQSSQRPIVAISMRAYLGKAALEAGAYTFVEKGSAPDNLLAALHAAVQPSDPRPQ